MDNKGAPIVLKAFKQIKLITHAKYTITLFTEWVQLVMITLSIYDKCSVNLDNKFPLVPLNCDITHKEETTAIKFTANPQV